MIITPSFNDFVTQATAGQLSSAVAEGKLQDEATAGLLSAAEEGDFATVQEYLANGADIEAFEPEVCQCVVGYSVSRI
jgi:hypothetical protein